MKQILDEIDSRFQEALKENQVWTKEEISEVYSKIKNDVFLEYLDKFVGRN